jgi:hypothetical protein
VAVTLDDNLLAVFDQIEELRERFRAVERCMGECYSELSD